MTPNDDRGQTRELVILARLFLWLGITGFGGPAAHIALMREEVVVRRQWLTVAEFLDLLAITNLIPGPNSTEMVMHIGKLRAGWRGLIVAGICFILPAAAITGGLAWAYARFGAVPAAGAVMMGVKPVVIAVVGQALWDFVPRVLRGAPRIVLALGMVGLYLAGLHEIAVLAVGAGIAVAVKVRSGAVSSSLLLLLLPIRDALAGVVGSEAATGFTLARLFLVFLKIGSVLYGSGYVLLAFLRGDLVESLGWLTEQQLLDAVAVGQATPGPVLTTATFIGYLIGGAPGAAVATIGIFLPAFLFVALTGPIVPWMRRSPVASAALDGLNVASLALLVVVCGQLARAAIVDGVTAGLAVLSVVLLVRFRVSSSWLLLLGVGVGVGVGVIGQWV